MQPTRLQQTRNTSAEESTTESLQRKSEEQFLLKKAYNSSGHILELCFLTALFFQDVV